MHLVSVSVRGKTLRKCCKLYWLQLLSFQKMCSRVLMVCTCLSGLFVAEGISQWLPSALKVQRLVDTLPNISIYQDITCLWKSSENTLSWEISISISQKATSLCGLKLQKCLRMSGWKSWKVEVIRFGFASCFAQEGSQMVDSFFFFFFHLNHPGNL